MTNMFYQTQTKEEFDGTCAEFLNNVSLMDKYAIEEHPIVFRVLDKHMHNLVNNYYQNFDPIQLNTFFMTILSKRLYSFQNCLNLFEYLINRTSLLDQINEEQFFEYLILVSNNRSLMSQSNYNLICDRFLLKIDKILFNKLNLETLDETAEKEKVCGEKIIFFITQNPQFNYDFLLKNLEKYVDMLQQLEFINEREYKAMQIVITDFKSKKYNIEDIDLIFCEYMIYLNNIY